MKHIIIIGLIFLHISSFSQKAKIDSAYLNTAFNVGEKLKYEVKYGLIKGGEAQMGLSLFPNGDSYVYYVKAIAYTTGMAAKLTYLRDIYESYIDIKSGYPIKSARNIHENNHTLYNEILFFRKDNYVISLNSGKHTIPYNTLDLLSAFYFARRHLFEKKLEKNDKISLITFHEEKIFPIHIKYIKTENVRTKFGKISCLKFIPIIEKDSPFKKEEDFQVWFSNDGNYIPVKIQMKLPVGSIYAKLIGFENLKNPFGGSPQK